MILGFDFDFMRILLAGGMLSIASLLDLRRREVSDLLWIVFGAMAAVIYFLEFVSGMTFDVVAIALPICISAASSYGIYRSGLFGGADALALVTLAVILPTFSGGLIEQVIPNRHAFLLHPVAPIIVLSNTIIFSMSQILLNLGRNATYVLTKRGRLYQGLEQEPLIRKVFAVLIGYKTVSKPRYAFPLEQVVDGKRQFSFAIRAAETAEYESSENVWVTPGTPFLFFMLIGFFAMLFVGDVASLLISSVFK